MATPHHLPKKRGALQSTQISFLRASQSFAISHNNLGESNKKITSGDDKRGSRRSTPSLRCTCRSDLLLGSRYLNRNRNKLTNPLSLGTLLNKNRLGWTNRNLNRSPLFSNKSRGHGLNHDIRLIKEALYGHAHSSRKFPTHGLINRKELRINLLKKKKILKKGKEEEEKEGRGQVLIEKEGINKHAKEKKEHTRTHGNANACKGKECISNSGSSSNMGRVVEVSSLCLDCQGRKKKGKGER